MLSRLQVRHKFILGVVLLMALIGMLTVSGFYGLYAYGALVRSLNRVAELRQATELASRVSDLRLAACQLSVWREEGFRFSLDAAPAIKDFRQVHDEFREHLGEAREAVVRYRDQLRPAGALGAGIDGGGRELATVRRIESRLDRIDRADRDHYWVFDRGKLEQLRKESEKLQVLAARLPSYLHENILKFADDVRLRYRTFIRLAWTSVILAAVVVLLLVRLVYRSVFRPLKELVHGSRQVASGRFDYRIQLSREDEIAVLANAMNDMTQRFVEVRNDLDRQVEERTRQHVRSEKLAGAGRLAAGVSHEINNPLASIAMSAESLERRLQESSLDEMRDDMRVYLNMIQSEARRCRGITDKLRDFSHMRDARRETAGLDRLAAEAIQVLEQVETYQSKRLRLTAQPGVAAQVNADEIKQVIMNLLTNALESTGEDGEVSVEVARRDGLAEIQVRDNGCGMSEEVLEHLFEPFFTRRQIGQGTGLGLSIADRIVSEHGGQIDAESEGPGKGSVFRIRLPVAE